MIKSYIVFDVKGSILKIITYFEDRIEDIVQNGLYLEGNANNAKQYIADIENPVVVDKPVSPITIDKTTVQGDGIDIITLTNVPDDSILIVLREKSALQALISDSETITFDLEGSYTLKVLSVNYLDYEVIINAT